MAALTHTEIRRSKWAQDFLAEAPGQFDAAMSYACGPDMTYRIIEQDDPDYPTFAVVPVVDDGFWMAVSDNHEELAELCVKMGWRYEYD